MTWPALDDFDLDVVMTTRHGGVSTGAYGSLNLGLHVGDEDELVIENRRRVSRSIQATLDDLIFCNQVHGREVRVVAGSDRGRGTTSLSTALDGVDAVVTAVPGLVLAMMVADCVPIALYARERHLASAVHSGWRGTVLRVADAAVQVMVELGASPGEIVAAIGPAVDPDIYQVGPEVMEAVSECFAGETDDMLRPGGSADSHTYFFDLWEANRRILVEAGLPPEQIFVAGVPTGGEGPFFSHRAECPCGRNALLVRLHPRP